LNQWKTNAINFQTSVIYAAVAKYPKKKKEHFTEQPDLDQGMQGIDDSVILAQIAAIIGAIASITQSNHD